MLKYWYLSNFFENGFGLTKSNSWIIALVFGFLAGISFYWNNNSKIRNIIIGGISGLITGFASIWITGGYLYLRGFPKSIIKFELIIVSAILIVLGVGIVNLFEKIIGKKKESQISEKK